MNTDLSLLRLMQLVSPSLPVGAYAYSQGLEYAVEMDWVSNEAEAADWIEGLLLHGLGRLDVPVLARLHRAWMLNDLAEAGEWNQFLYACRESAELQAEDRALARALTRLLSDMNVAAADELASVGTLTYAAPFALAASRWSIPAGDCLKGYIWAWLENQVLAAIKLVPLGQTAGQRLLLRLADRIPGVVDRAMQMHDEDIGQLTHGLAMASAWHETQYSRLFRS